MSSLHSFYVVLVSVCSVSLRNVSSFSFGAALPGTLLNNSATVLSTRATHTRKIIDLKRDEILTHLLQTGGLKTDLNKPSTAFMIDVFERLLSGNQLPDAVGHTDGQSRPEVLYSDTVRSFSASKNTVERTHTFHIPHLPKHEHLKMVELRFHAGNTNIRRRQKFTLFVRRHGETLEKLKFTLMQGSKSIMDLTDMLTSVINLYHGNLTIELRNRTQITDKVRHNQNVQSYIADPILVLYSQDKQFLKTVYKTFTDENSNQVRQETVFNSRRKRATKTEREDRKKRRRKKNKWRKGEICKMHDFKVDFDLIGWGPWIIHPKTFNAKVCYGQCPSPIGHEYSPTNHAMLQTLMRMKRPLSAPEPCCVPTKLKPLSMLYFEYDDIVVRHHQDMVTAECGCR